MMRAVAAAGLGDPAGDVGPDDQPLARAPCSSDQPVGVARVGRDSWRRRAPRARPSASLSSFEAGFSAAGEQRDRIAGRRRLEQGLERRRRISSPAGSTRIQRAPPNMEMRRRLVGEPRRIGLELGAGEVDPLGLRRPAPRRAPWRARALPEFVGAVEEEEAGVGRRLQRLARAAAWFAFIARGARRCASRRARPARRSGRRPRPTSRSSAVCSAATVAYSEETTSMPASEPAVASSSTVPRAGVDQPVAGAQGPPLAGHRIVASGCRSR